MSITRIDVPGLHRTAGYAHVTTVESVRIATIAGQCPLDQEANVVGHGDVLAQVDRVVANALAVLAEVGVGADSVVRSVIYVVSADSAVRASVWDRLMASALGPAFTTASTLLGVTALGYADQLVEIDLTAALP